MADYNTLLADIPAYMENPTAELAAVLPTIVKTAQDRIYRDVNVQAMETVEASTLVANDPLLPRPADLIQPRYLRIILPSGRTKVLEIKQVEFLWEYWPDEAATGEPRYYAVEDGGSYRVCPTPDRGYPYRFGYKRRLPELSANDPENWLTQVAYDLLLAACLAEAGRFVLDDRQNSIVSLWEAKYDAMVKAVNAVDQRAERDDYRVPFVAGENR